MLTVQLSRLLAFGFCYLGFLHAEFGSVLVSTWTSKGGYSTIHRFFDTSPFSPCGRYLALTRFAKGDFVEENEVYVVVVDLMERREIVAGTSRAWGSQLGAQVQWGDPVAIGDIDTSVGILPRNSTVVYYNDNIYRMVISADYGGLQSKVGAAPHIVCVAFDVATGRRTVLKGPLYQVQHSQHPTSGFVESQHFLASPDLMAIRHTQKGYGADHLDIKTDTYSQVKFKSPAVPLATKSGLTIMERLLHDGLFVTNVRFNKCFLALSLYELLYMVAKWPLPAPVSAPRTASMLYSVPTVEAYGFHVKWSDDNRLLMFIVRTVHRYGRAPDRPKRRRQHMFVIDFAALMQFRKNNRGIPGYAPGDGDGEPEWLVERNSSRRCYQHHFVDADVLLSDGNDSNAKGSDVIMGSTSSSANASSSPNRWKWTEIKNRARYESLLNQAVHYVLSWGNIDQGRGEQQSTSSDSNCGNCTYGNTNIAPDFNVQLDGNHPNFVTGSHRIVMNLESPSSLFWPHHQNKSEIDRHDDRTQSRQYAIVTVDIPALISEKKRVGLTGKFVRTTSAGGRAGSDIGNGSDVVSATYFWQIADTHTHLNLSRQRSNPAYVLYLYNLLTFTKEVYPYGSGHPTMFAFPTQSDSDTDTNANFGYGTASITDTTNRFFVLTDCYLKELAVLKGQLFRNKHVVRLSDDPNTASTVDDDDDDDVTTPIRLIDLNSQKEVWIAYSTVKSPSKSGFWGDIDVFYGFLRRTSTGGHPNGWSWFSAFHDYATAVYHALVDSKSFRHNRLNHWRCDPHVTLSLDANRIAFNSIVNGNRQVFVSDTIIRGRRALLQPGTA